jgi:hypothetical protein
MITAPVLKTERVQNCMFAQSFGDLDAPAVPNQPFIADSLYRSSIGIPPSKSKEAKGEIGMG